MPGESGDTIHDCGLEERASRCVTVHMPTPAGHIDRSPEALPEAQVSRYCRRSIDAIGAMRVRCLRRSVR